MTSLNLLNNLVPFWQFLENLRKRFLESHDIKYSSFLEQSYNFIQLELRDEDDNIFLEVRYQILLKNKLSFYSFYCEDENMSSQIKGQTYQLLGDFAWDSNTEFKFVLNDEQIKYLEIADRIAFFGNDIDGSPSYYGAFIITSFYIKLKQVNHQNSRSLDHKDSYFLRDLSFIIPFKDDNIGIKKSKFKCYYIGDMEVRFLDRSAISNMETGEKIWSQLQKEIENY